MTSEFIVKTEGHHTYAYNPKIIGKLMTDKLTEIINSKRMFDDTTLFNSQTEKLAREIAKQYAAHEVDRLLDCIAESLKTSDSEFLGIPIEDGKFDWYMSSIDHRGNETISAEGNGKPSLLKYVGFSE